MKRILYIYLLVAISAVLAGCNSSEPSHSTIPETAKARVVESRREPTPVIVRATGTLHARQSVSVSAQVVARVQQMLVKEGDSVRAGQMLAVLDDATLRDSEDQTEAAVKAAEHERAVAQSNADLAASTLARYKQLQSQKSVSPQEFDEVSRKSEAASAQLEAAQAQLAAAKAQANASRTMLSYSRVVAPFAGVITTRMADPGALASPGIPLVQIDSAGPLQLQAVVAESAIGAIRNGMKLRITTDAVPGVDPIGIVAEILPAADVTSHSFLVKIDLAPSSRLRAGMYASAEIPTGTRDAILVPRSAVVVRGSLPCSYVLDSNGIAQLRYVTLGAQQGALVEVLSGIAAGERLVDDPADRELAGKRIEVQP